MTDVEKIKHNLEYVSNAMRSNRTEGGNPALYFLWGLLLFIGFASADLAPQITPLYFFVASICGGLFSWWLRERTDRREGINNTSAGRRIGLHWLVSGIAFLLAFISMVAKPGTAGPELFLLVGGLSYSLAGVHLIRPLIYSGMLMLACYVLMILLTPPYAWILTGLTIGIGLVWTGLVQRARWSRGGTQ